MQQQVGPAATQDDGAELAATRAALSQALTDKEILQLHLDQLEADIAEAEAQRQENLAATVRLAEQERLLHAAQQRNAELQTVVDTLIGADGDVEAISRLTRAVVEHEALRARVDEAETELKAAQKAAESGKAQLQRVTEERDRVAAEFRRHKQMQESVKKYLSSAHSAMDAKDELLAKIERLERELDECRTTASRTQQSLVDNFPGADTFLREIDEKLSELTKEHKKSTEGLIKIKEELEESRQTKSSRREDKLLYIEEHQKVRIKVQEGALQTCQRLRKQAELITQKLKDQEARLHASKGRDDEGLKNDILKSRKELAELRGNLHKMEDARIKLQEANNVIEGLRLKCQAQKREIQDLMADILLGTGGHSQLQARQQELEEEKDRLRGRLKKLAEAVDESETVARKSLESEVNLRKQLSKTMHEMDALRRDANILREARRKHRALERNGHAISDGERNKQHLASEGEMALMQGALEENALLRESVEILKKQLAAPEAQARQQAAALEARLEQAGEDYRHEVQVLRAEHEARVESLTAEKEGLCRILLVDSKAQPVPRKLTTHAGEYATLSEIVEPEATDFLGIMERRARILDGKRAPRLDADENALVQKWLALLRDKAGLAQLYSEHFWERNPGWDPVDEAAALYERWQSVTGLPETAVAGVALLRAQVTLDHAGPDDPRTYEALEALRGMRKALESTTVWRRRMVAFRQRMEQTWNKNTSLSLPPKGTCGCTIRTRHCGMHDALQEDGPCGCEDYTMTALCKKHEGEVEKTGVSVRVVPKNLRPTT